MGGIKSLFEQYFVYKNNPESPLVTTVANITIRLVEKFHSLYIYNKLIN